MRLSTLLFSLSASCAVLLPAAVSAQSLPAAPSVPAAAVDDDARAALSQVQVRGQTRRHRLDADEAKKVRGTYAMSNGWTLQVTPRARQIYIAINDGAPIELLAQSGDKFASADGNIATVFNLGPWGDDVVMSYVPDGRLSDERVVIGSSSLAAR